MSPRRREIPSHLRPWDYSKETEGVRATPRWQDAHRKYLAVAEEPRGDENDVFNRTCAAAYELYVVEAAYAGQMPKPMHELLAMPRFYPTP